MPFDTAYHRDGEFLKLLTRRQDVDLIAACLELARDVDPTFEATTVTDWIDARAAEVRGPVARADSEADALAELGCCINGTHGVTGGCAAYDTADGSYLHRVIAAGTGLPISLSVLYMAVAQRVGLDLVGVAAPQHFMTRYESCEGPLFVDAFHGGRVLTLPECLTFLSNLTCLPPATLEPALEPVDCRRIIMRMLNNLKCLHAGRDEWSAAYAVQHRLVALLPCDYQQCRDLATISLNAGHPGQAVDLLQSCLNRGPAADHAALEQQLDRARSQLCRLN